jgi:hypothetical protein
MTIFIPALLLLQIIDENINKQKHGYWEASPVLISHRKNMFISKVIKSSWDHYRYKCALSSHILLKVCVVL